MLNAFLTFFINKAVFHKHCFTPDVLDNLINDIYQLINLKKEMLKMHYCTFILMYNYYYKATINM